ncbi:MAG TPA: beta-propeller fold lactonase family protein [Acidisphaera sp.]|nr:beta-propeller fold lactonase family protein [Acidisphaera sp.]
MTRILAAAFLLISAAAAQAHGVAFVINSGSASVSILDMSTGAELRRIPALREPHHWALSPDGKSLIIGDSAGNQLLFLDPATGDVQRRVPCADPYQLGFSPNGKFLVVNGLARNQVDVYDVATYTLIKRFPLSSMPSHMAYAPDSSMVYVSLQGTDKLAAIDLIRMAVVWVQPTGKTPAGVLWLNGRVLVANMGEDGLSVVDPVDGHVERRVHTGRGAHQLFLSPDGHTLYVNNRVEGTTAALDPATLEIRRTYAISGGPDDISFAPNGDLWITQRFAEKVAVLDPRTGVLTHYQVGRSPHGIFLNASGE